MEDNAYDTSDVEVPEVEVPAELQEAWDARTELITERDRLYAALVINDQQLEAASERIRLAYHDAFGPKS